MAKAAFLPADWLPAKRLQMQREMLLEMEKWAWSTEGRLRLDIWSLLKAQAKEGWAIKVHMVVRFSLKRWCHMFENLPFHLISNGSLGNDPATQGLVGKELSP